MSLRVRPTTLEEANNFVRVMHRHSRPTTGQKFSCGLVDDARDGILVGVAIGGRPVAPDLDDGYAFEIYRNCTDGTRKDPATALELRRLLALTPFARSEQRRAYEAPRNPIEAAAFMIMRSFMGFGSASTTRRHMTGFRTSSKRDLGSSSTPAVEWASWPNEVPAFVDRLRGVVIENRDAVEVILQHDTPSTLFYVDPPYVQSTRSSLKNLNGNRGHYYKHDCSDADHRRLAECLNALTGMVVVSGYPSELYDGLFAGWERHDKTHMADGARPRLEVIWINPACSRALASSPRPSRQLFHAEPGEGTTERDRV